MIDQLENQIRCTEIKRITHGSRVVVHINGTPIGSSMKRHHFHRGTREVGDTWSNTSLPIRPADRPRVFCLFVNPTMSE
jgi:hypothetical protein